MDSEISLFEIANIVKRSALFIAVFIFVCTGVSFFVCKKMTKIYQADVLILPMGGGGGGLNLLGQVAPSLASNMLFMGPMDSQGKKLKIFLESRTFSERFAKSHDLLKSLYPKLWDASKGEWKVKDPSTIPTIEDAAGMLRGMIKIKEDALKGTLTLSIEATDPNLAANLANDVTSELRQYLQENVFSDAKRNRVSVGQQLETTRREYLESGKALTDYYQRNKVSASIPEINVNVAVGIDQAVDFNDMTSLSQHIGTLLEQKRDIDQKLEGFQIVQRVPQQIYLEYVLMKRGVLSQIYSALTQQYEAAKITESKEDVFFEVIDDARPPNGPSKPKTRQIVLLTFVFSALLAVFASVCVEYLRRNA